MADVKHRSDDYVKDLLTPNEKTAIRKDAGMFIVRYNPQDSLEGTTPACQYNVGVNSKDNIASALRKNAKDIQNVLDDWFGADESDKSQRVFVSHQEKINEKEAYCTVTYAGYESDNVGEVSALLSDQISHVIDTRIRMDWNDDAYEVTEGFVEQQAAKEAYRKEMDAAYVENKSAGVTKDNNIATLNDSLYSEEKAKTIGMEM